MILWVFFLLNIDEAIEGVIISSGLFLLSEIKKKDNINKQIFEYFLFLVLINKYHSTIKQIQLYIRIWKTILARFFSPHVFIHT